MTSSKTARFIATAAWAAALILGASEQATAQSRGLRAIRAEDMKRHLEFLAAPEFRGRPAPSAEVDIASLYVAIEARRLGLKPLLADGGYLQYFPVEVKSVAPERSGLTLIEGGRRQVFGFPASFSPAARSGGEEGVVSAQPVFLGSVLSATPVEAWERLDLPDLTGKIAVVLDVPQTAGPGQAVPGPGPLAAARSRLLKEKGAWGIVSIIRPEREKELAVDDAGFHAAESQRFSFPSIETGYGESAPAAPAGPAPPPPFLWIEARHVAAAAIIGIAPAEVEAMFAAAGSGTAAGARALPGRTLEIAVHYATRRSRTPNVVAWLEGADRKLKNEYVVIGSHQDHLSERDGRVLPGADDNGSGTVGMISLAKALLAERPRRSVIFVWHTAEERGLIGAYHFVQHCPVPVEKISANLNLDMISRNDPDMIHLIGSNKLSTGLDAAIHAANARSVRLKLDYAYESPQHPDRFFFRSDQLPYIRYGIPGVWFFCGTTPDYHQPTDTLERCDFGKMEKVTKLVYLTALDIGNRPDLLPLDVNPAVTRRGPENMRYDWRKPEAGK